MSKRATVATLLFSVLFMAIPVGAQNAAPAAQSIAEKTKDAQKLQGYFNLYWDAKQGKLWLEFDKWSTEFLYQSSLPAGIGLDGIVSDPSEMGPQGLGGFGRGVGKVLCGKGTFWFFCSGSE